VTKSDIKFGYLCYGTVIELPPELEGREKPTDFHAYMKLVRPLLEQAKACHPCLDPNLAREKDIYAAFEKYMMGNNLRGRLYKNRFPRWETQYNHHDDYIVWLLKRWTNWLGQEERLGLFGL
jgi:hypothetical protein